MTDQLSVSRKAIKQLVSSYPLITPYTFYSELCSLGLFLPSDTKYAKFLNPFDSEGLPEGSFIYCVTERAQELYRHIESTACKDISVILGRSTLEVDSEYLELLRSGKVISLYAQNTRLSHDRVFSIPLGLENKNWRFDDAPSNSPSLLWNHILLQNKTPRVHKFLAAFSLHTAPRERSECLKSVMNIKGVHIPRLNTSERGLEAMKRYYQDLLSSQYVVCPPGAGLDTHRFWQALYLGCVPIIHKDSLMPYHAHLDSSSFVSVSHWGQLADLPDLERDLSKSDSEFSFKRCLGFDYWQKQLLEHQDQFL